MIAVAIVAGLSLAVLAAAVVDLAGSSSPTRIDGTRTVAGPASVTSPGTVTTTPAPSATTPAATTPSAGAPVAAGPVGLAPVTALTSSAATLNGVVNPQGVPTTYQFRVGPTASHEGGAHSAVALGAGTSAIAVNSRVAFLTPGTTYHYRLTASKAGRIVSTPDATFTTPPGGASTQR
jgi:hypothetical protein